MGAMGQSPHGQTVVVAMPSSRPHRNLNFVMPFFEAVKCTLKYDFIIMPMTKVAQISA